MSILTDHPTEHHQEKGTFGHRHPSNRPAGYVDARCVRCHGAMFVPLGTTHPCHEKCPPPSPEHQSAEEQRGLAYVHRRLGKVSFVEFLQTRRYQHFASGKVTTFNETWGCIINVATGANFHGGNGDTAAAAAEAACARVLEERARLAKEAEHEIFDSQNDGERFDGGPL